MRSLTRRLAVLAAAAALTVTAAACSSTTQASNTGATAGSSPAASTGAGFPVSLAAANGTVKVASRPTAIVSLSPTATEMLYAIGAGSQVKAVDSLSDYPAAGAADQAVRLPAQRRGDRRGKAGPGGRVG